MLNCLTGAVAFLLPTSDGFVYDFTMVEIYGGAHLTVNGTNIHIKSVKVVGDDTGHLHIPPHHTLELIEVRGNKYIFRGGEGEIQVQIVKDKGSLDI